MPEIGFSELLVVALVLLVVVGPERLPEVFAQAARAWREVRRWILDIRRAWREEMAAVAEPLAEAEEKLREEVEKGGHTLRETAREVKREAEGIVRDD